MYVIDCSDIKRGLQKAASVLLPYFFLERIHLPPPSEQGPQDTQMSKVLEEDYQTELFQVLSKR